MDINANRYLYELAIVVMCRGIGNLMEIKLAFIGIFCIKDDGEGYISGEILEEISPGYYLIKFDNLKKNDGIDPPLEVHSVKSFAQDKLDYGMAWTFFETREKLDIWLGWLGEPRKNVVSLVKKLGEWGL